MANVLKYRGYRGKIEFSEEDEMLIGSVIGIKDALYFHGHSVEEIIQSFHDSIDNYLEMCKVLGKSPDKEYKGSLNIRISQDLHRKAAQMADEEGISLNQFIQNAIEESVNSDKYKRTVIMLPPILEQSTMLATRSVYDSSRYRLQPSGQLS